MCHAGLWLKGDTLYAFWSRVGNTPERISSRVGIMRLGGE